MSQPSLFEPGDDEAFLDVPLRGAIEYAPPPEPIHQPTLAFFAGMLHYHSLSDENARKRKVTADERETLVRIAAEAVLQSRAALARLRPVYPATRG